MSIAPFPEWVDVTTNREGRVTIYAHGSLVRVRTFLNIEQAHSWLGQQQYLRITPLRTGTSLDGTYRRPKGSGL